MKQENETQLEYIKRLVYDKMVYKLITVDYSELSELVFGKGNNFNTSEVRKRFYGLKYLFDLIEKEEININKNDILKEYDNKKIELQKERNKIQTLRQDLNRIIRETSRTELFYEEFINTIKQLEKIPTPIFKPLKIQDIKKEYILTFADSHFGKEFKSITNEYNLNIVYDRFNNLLSEVIEIVNKENIESLIILCLGNLIEGMCLRISQLQSLKIGITEQTIQFMRFIVSWLSKLSEYVKINYYQVPSANHSQIRPFGSKSNDFVLEDNEKIIFAYINDMLENNKRINIVENKEIYTILKIFNYNIIACHGHKIKNFNNFIKDISFKYKIFFDYAFFAHKHHSATLVVGEGISNNCEMIKVPAIMGSDDYADDLLVGSKPGATLIEFTEKQGKRKLYDLILE